MNKFLFTIPTAPQGKARARTFYNSRMGKMQSITPEKTRSYEDLVRYCFQSEGGKFTDKPVMVKIKAYFKFPSAMPKKVKLQALAGLVVPTVKPDADNIEKIIFDALNGFAYKDDTQIAENHTVKLFSDEPRVEVEIEEIPVVYYKKGNKFIEQNFRGV